MVAVLGKIYWYSQHSYARSIFKVYRQAELSRGQLQSRFLT